MTGGIVRGMIPGMVPWPVRVLSCTHTHTHTHTHKTATENDDAATLRHTCILIFSSIYVCWVSVEVLTAFFLVGINGVSVSPLDLLFHCVRGSLNVISFFGLVCLIIVVLHLLHLTVLGRNVYTHLATGGPGSFVVAPDNATMKARMLRWATEGSGWLHGYWEFDWASYIFDYNYSQLLAYHQQLYIRI